MRKHRVRWVGAAALAAAGALFTACSPKPASDIGAGGDTGSGTGGGMGMGGSGAGGNTMGLKLGTGGPFGFPQSKVSGTCALTTNAGAIAQTQTAYNAWKNAFVTSNGAGAVGNLRVQRGQDNSNDSVSEGIGYGMLAAVYMGDQPTFDSLWRYGQSHFNTKGLMSWHINAGGGTLDPGSASDGDVDMIWALIMASDQWSSQTYLTAAGNMIHAMRQNSIGPDGLLKPGDTWGGTALTNPSYFSPAYFRVFAVVSGDLLWSRDILDKNYLVLSTVSGADGLVPDWTTDDAVVNMDSLTMPTGSNSTYGYDAARTPWRIAMDWCFNQEPRAQAYLMKVGAFFNPMAGNIGNVGDGYALNGSVKSSNHNMAFIGPLGVAGMAGFPALTNAAFMYGVSNQGDLNYYPSSLRMITMLMMSGNFLDYTKM
jgi:endo-1,4-beta-D-glucanase Y